MKDPEWDSARWGKVSAHFNRALDLAPEDRDALLRELEREAPEIAQAVTRMLAADAAFTTDTPPAATAMLVRSFDPALSPGTRLGAYLIESSLGVGGMGRVYRASREVDGVTQAVAIKCLRFADRDPEFMRRFVRERKILARMDHPHIARFLDAGTDPNGQPYVALQYVDGVAITEFARLQRLSLRARISLLLKVMSAVAYLHRQLIVHRDIKPGNVIVDAAGEPYLLDFGIAKSLPHGAIPADGETAAEHRAYSIAYAAPEQLVDSLPATACDIYSLGALAYELICTHPPLELAGLPQATAARRLQDCLPPPPSDRIDANAQAPDGTDGKIWRRALRGDLDNLVLHALRKEPNERYATVEAFMSDLENYLAYKPVSLRRGHRYYRLRKFVQRNRVWVVAALLAAALLVVGLVAVIWQSRIAIRRSAELEQVTAFQAHMLRRVDPAEAGRSLSRDVKSRFDQWLTRANLPSAEHAAQRKAFDAMWLRVSSTDVARELIDATILRPAVQAIDEQFKDQPVVEATLRQVLADRYLEIGLYDAALPLQQRALALREEWVGERHPDTLASKQSMALLMHRTRRFVEAERYIRESLDMRRRVLGADHPDTLASARHLSEALRDLGRWHDAELNLLAVLPTHRRSLGEEHDDTLLVINHLGYLLRKQGKFEQAEPYFLEELEKYRRLYGESHPETMHLINRMCVNPQQRGKLAEAEPYCRDLLEKRRSMLGENHALTVDAIGKLVELLRQQGKSLESEPGLRQAWEDHRAELQIPPADAMPSLNNIDVQLRDAGVQSELESSYLESLEGIRLAKGEDSPEAVSANMAIGMLLHYRGSVQQAEAYYREALKKGRAVLGDESPDTLTVINNLGSLLVSIGKYADAEGLLAPAEAATRLVFATQEAHRLANLLTNLGKARIRLQHFAAAEKNLLEAHAILAQSPGPNPSDARGCLQALVDLYTNMHRAEPMAGHDRNAAQWALRMTEVSASGAASPASRMAATAASLTGSSDARPASMTSQ